MMRIETISLSMATGTTERRWKAQKLLEMGEESYRKASEFEEEYENRARAARACEDVFHAFVEGVGVVLEDHGRSLPEGHQERADVLFGIGRRDLEKQYNEAKEVLHDRCYCGQKISSGQERTMSEVRTFLKKEVL